MERIGEKESIKNIKFVGLHIDEKLTWKYHMESVFKKMSSGLRALTQCKKILPMSLKRLIYNGIMKPHLEYGLILWGSVKGPMRKSIETLQKKAIRAIAGTNYNAHTTPWFAELGLLKLEHLYQVSACKEAEKIIRKLVPQELKQTCSIANPQRATRHNQSTK